jgi:hypothetical protein
MLEGEGDFDDKEDQRDKTKAIGQRCAGAYPMVETRSPQRRCRL